MRSASMSWRVLKRGAAVLERELTTPAIERIIRTAQGDARRCLNLLEWSHHLVPQGPLTEEAVSVAADRVAVLGDRQGDHHYDTISALIKSLRASDSNAALHYLGVCSRRAKTSPSSPAAW